MARGINKVILIGNLGADPETRAMPSGTTVANLRVATSESWRDKQTGEQQERTESGIGWRSSGGLRRSPGNTCAKARRCISRAACARAKGWQDKQGNERYSTEIIGNDLQMLGGRGGAGGRCGRGCGYIRCSRGDGRAQRWWRRPRQRRAILLRGSPPVAAAPHAARNSTTIFPSERCFRTRSRARAAPRQCRGRW